MSTMSSLVSLALAAFVCNLAAGQHLTVSNLDYAYDALEPYVPEEIMRVHHQGHHAAYTEKTNSLLAELRADEVTKPLAKAGVDFIVENLRLVPTRMRTAFRNNAGGYVNHEMFWKMMTPSHLNGTSNRGGVFDFESPFGKVVDHIFNGAPGFKKAIKDQAVALFGSGWVWLEVDIGGSEPTLVLSATQNQDSPFMKTGRHPIFALDVWEHAYYLKYKNRRAEYIDAFWNVFNFDEVNKRYLKALEEAGHPGPIRAIRLEPIEPAEIDVLRDPRTKNKVEL